MSKANKHRTNQINGIALDYMHTVLGPWVRCPRASCQGTMIEVSVRYQDKGPIHNERECIECGKIQRDPAFREKNQQYWKQQNSNRNYKSRNNRFRSNNNGSNSRPPKSSNNNSSTKR